MRRPVLAVPLAAMATAALLVVAVVGVVVHEPAVAARGVGRPGGGGRPPGRPAVSIEAVLPELVAFVERERGLPFLRPVDVELLDDDDFEERLGAPDDDARREVEDVQAVLEAMGLLPRSVDLLELVDEFARQATLGFYDAETDQLVVRGSEASPLARTTLVHELVHALEDQHFDLDRPDLGDEAASGFLALAEGSAVVVEEGYLESLPASERRLALGAELAQGRGISADVPEVVQIAFGFPYTFGPDLVRAVLDAGGRPRLDEAFARPPLTTEQVLDPVKYLGGDGPRAVRAPRADRPPFDEGEIGELFLILMLRAELRDDEAQDAARGWGGDRYVAWRDGDRTCVRMSFVMDTPADTRELTRALANWAAERPATASASGTALRTCS